MGIFFDSSSRSFDIIAPNFIQSKLYNRGFQSVFLRWLHFKSENMCWIWRFPIRKGTWSYSRFSPGIFFIFSLNDPPYNIEAEKTSIFVVKVESVGEFVIISKTLVENFYVLYHSNWSWTQIIEIDLKQSPPLTLSCNLEVLVSAESARLLSLVVDSRLRLIEHRISCRKSVLPIILSVDLGISARCFISVYYGVVYNYSTHNVDIWCTSIKLHRIFVAQKGIFKIFNDNLILKHERLELSCKYIHEILL